MHFHLLPPALIFLLLSITSTHAAPIALPESKGIHCGAISFLSPRYQSVLGLRKFCSALHEHDSTLAGRSLSGHEDNQQDASQYQPEMLFGPPGELFPADQLEAHSSRLRELDVDLELDLARMRHTYQHGHIHTKATSLRTAKEHIAQLGRYTWTDFQRRTSSFFTAIEDIDEHIALVGSSAIVSVVLVLIALELFITKRKLRQQRIRQRVMRQVVRRGTRIRVKSHPFSLATIVEESQKQLLPIEEASHWDEKSQVIVSLTPTC